MKNQKNVYVGNGTSDNEDPYLAGKEAVEQAIEKCGKSPDFGFVFCSGGKYADNGKKIKRFVEGADQAFAAVSKKCRWIGCTTGGEIFPTGGQRNSAVAMVVQSDYIRTSVGIGTHVSKNPRQAGMKAADNALKHLKLDHYVDSYIRFETTKKKTSKELAKMKQFLLITLSPGFTFKQSGWEEEIVKGVQEIAGMETPIVGGSAADDSKFLKNYQFANGELFEDSIVCLSVFSNIKFGLGLAHGYESTDKIVLVTKAEGNIAYEFNNRPALDVYSELVGVSKDKFTKGINFVQAMGRILPDFMLKLGQKYGKSTEDMMKDFPFFMHIMESPLAIPDVNRDHWLRVPKGITKEGGIEFYNPILQGHPLVFMRANDEKYMQAGAESLKNSMIDFNGKPAFSLIFECLGRYVFLKDNLDLNETFRKMKKVINTDNFIGFYTSCEVGASKNLPSGSHSYTCSSVSFSDELIT